MSSLVYVFVSHNIMIIFYQFREEERERGEKTKTKHYSHVFHIKNGCTKTTLRRPADSDSATTYFDIMIILYQLQERKERERIIVVFFTLKCTNAALRQRPTDSPHSNKGNQPGKSVPNSRCTVLPPFTKTPLETAGGSDSRLIFQSPDNRSR